MFHNGCRFNSNFSKVMVVITNIINGITIDCDGKTE